MRVWLPFVDSTHKIGDTKKAIDYLVDGINEQFYILYKNKFVGLIGFKDTDTNNKKTEIGYWLSLYVQGNGIIA